jgi:hypothetical protein
MNGGSLKPAANQHDPPARAKLVAMPGSSPVPPPVMRAVSPLSENEFIIYSFSMICNAAFM